MDIPESDDWDASSLPHWFTLSFFRSQYGDKVTFVTETRERRNSEMLYYNIADSDNSTNASICAGLLVNYMEGQGLPYHDDEDKNRTACFNALIEHLSKGDGHVLFTADIVDYYFKFLGE